MARKVALLFVLAGLMLSGEVRAQAPPPFGPPINLEDAKRVAAAAVAEVAKAGSTPDSIAIVDHGGFLIHFERMDNASLATVEIAIERRGRPRCSVDRQRSSRMPSPVVATRSWRCMARSRSRAACRSSPAARSSVRSAPAAARLHRTARWRRPVPTRSNRAGK